jgi:hypothetical protein
MTAWLSDLLQGTEIVDATSGTEIVYSRRGRLRFVPGGTIVDNPAKNSTDIGVDFFGGGGGGGGTGNVIGPAGGANDNAIARYDTTTGRLLQNSLAQLADNGDIVTPGVINGVRVSYVVITPASLAANANNYSPTDAITPSATWASADIVRLSASTPVNITGFGLIADDSKSRKYVCNVGTQTITLKFQDGASASDGRILSSTGADVALTPNMGVWLYYDDTTSRYRVTPPGVGGGGGASLFTTLGLGDDAAGRNIQHIGFLSSNAELDIRAGATTILYTSAGESFLTAAATKRVGFVVGGVDIGGFFDGGTCNALAGAKTRDEFRITAFATPGTDGTKVSIVAGAATGPGDHAGGVVTLRGTAGSNLGAAGWVEITKVGGGALAKFSETGVDITGALTGTGLGSFVTGLFGTLTTTGGADIATNLIVRNAGVGTPVSLSGTIQLPNVHSTSARNVGNTADLLIESMDSGNNIQFGNGTTPFTDLRSASSTRLVVAGIARFFATTSFVQSALQLLLTDTAPIFSILPSATGTTATMVIRGQDPVNTGFASGGPLAISGGRNGIVGGTGKRGNTMIGLRANNDTFTPLFEVAELATPGQRVIALLLGAAITSTQMPANTGDLVIFLGNCATAPTANPVGGQILYVEAGVLKARGPSGTVGTLNAA